MSALDQIDETITKQLKNDEGKIIWEYSKNYNERFSYKLIIVDTETLEEKTEVFMNKNQMVEWLNKNGWKINTLSRS